MKNVCIVGYGNIGPIHADGVSRAAHANLYGICDICADRLTAAQAAYPAVKAYAAYTEVLADPAVDAVHICTPHFLHQPMAAQALAAGKAVLLEKPVCINMQELDILYHDKDAAIGVVLQNRYNPSIQTMLQKIQEGSLGKLLGLTAFVAWQRDAAYYQSGDWRGKWATEGGGLLINQAVHTIDLLSLLGGGITSVRASISNKSLDGIIEVEDTADAYLTFGSGARGVFYATNAYVTTQPVQIELLFEKAKFRYADGILYDLQGDPQVIASDSPAAQGKKYWGNGHTRLIEQFYTALENGTRDYITLSDAYNSSKALLAFYESAKENKTILL